MQLQLRRHLILLQSCPWDPGILRPLLVLQPLDDGLVVVVHPVHTGLDLLHYLLDWPAVVPVGILHEVLKLAQLELGVEAFGGELKEGVDVRHLRAHAGRDSRMLHCRSLKGRWGLTRR